MVRRPAGGIDLPRGDHVEEATVNKLRNRYLVLALSTAALAAAGCGSSSKSKTTAKTPPAPSTPVTPSTPSTTGTTSLAGVSASTPITDPRVRSLLIQGEQSRNQGRFSPTQLGNFADCLIKKLQGEGVKTLGELQQHRSEASTLGRSCASTLTK
jgi:hypothetical protein